MLGAAIVVALLAAAGALAWSRPAFQDWLLLRGASAQLRRSVAAFPAPDGIRVILCGTSPPPPSRTRAKSCAAVMVGRRIFIVDTGPGSANNLSLWGFPMARISGVLLTHFHSDHIGDLGEFRMLSWTAGRSAPLPVYGPDGVDRVVAGFNLAYHFDDDYRGALHGLPKGNAPLAAHPFGLAGADQRAKHMADVVILDDGGLKITAFQVNHEPVYPAVGYRFDYKGRSVVFSGDTVRSPNLIAHARRVDLLVHEGQSEEARRVLVRALDQNGQSGLARVMTRVAVYHATPADAVSVANDAKVRLLVFNHMGPVDPGNVLTEAIFTRGLASLRPARDWKLGFDGMIIDLPAGSPAIATSSVE